MIQRKPVTKKCPLMDGKQCMDKDCMLFHEQPNSSVAYCSLSRADSLSGVELRLDRLKTGVDHLLEHLTRS